MVFQWAAAATFVSVVASSLAVLIHAVQDSRCTRIGCCCDLVACDRVPHEERTPEPITAPE